MIGGFFCMIYNCNIEFASHRYTCPSCITTCFDGRGGLDELNISYRGISRLAKQDKHGLQKVNPPPMKMTSPHSSQQNLFIALNITILFL